jgi:hypothetical protein
MNLEDIPSELIVKHMFEIDRSKESFMLAKKFGRKKHLLDVESFFSLMRTNKTICKNLLLYLDAQGFDCANFSCASIFKYLKAESFANIFLKQHIPIKVVNNNIVALPLNTIITSATSTLNFTITLSELTNKMLLKITFDLNFGNMESNQQQIVATTAQALIVSEVKGFCTNECIELPSIIYILLNEHNNLLKKSNVLWKRIGVNNLFSISFTVSPYEKDLKVPLESLKFQDEIIFPDGKTYYELNRENK